MTTTTFGGRHRDPMAGRGLAVARGCIVAARASAHAHAGMMRYVDDDGLDGFNCTNAPYTTISAAVAASKQGDEIRVCPANYEEQVVIPFDMTIRGEAFGSRRAVITPDRMPATLPGLDGGNPIAAAVLDDGHLLRMSDVDIDLANKHRRGLLAGPRRRLRPERVGVPRADRGLQRDRERASRLRQRRRDPGRERRRRRSFSGSPYSESRASSRRASASRTSRRPDFVGDRSEHARTDGRTASRRGRRRWSATRCRIGYEFAKGARGKIINSTADTSSARQPESSQLGSSCTRPAR